MSEQKHCDQCENRCPADALRCNRGRLHFGLKPVEPTFPEGPVGMLQKCGFILHHSSIEPEDALSSLTEQEQAELARLLSIVMEDWQKRRQAGQPHQGLKQS